MKNAAYGRGDAFLKGKNNEVVQAETHPSRCALLINERRRTVRIDIIT